MREAEGGRIAARGVWIVAMLALLPTGAPATAAAGWEYGDEGLAYESSDGDFTLEVGNRAQVRFVWEDPRPGDSKGSFDIARYKLRIRGTMFRNWEYLLQSDLAAGSESGGRLLEDAVFMYVADHRAQLWVGQGKTVFGRQQLTSTGDQQFVDRSIATTRFAHGRDVGIAVTGHNMNRTYEYAAGLYNGNGINKDEGDNIDYMGALRLVFTPYGEFPLAETDLERSRQSRLAIGVSAMFNTTGTEGFEEERVTRGGLELAYRKGGFGVVGEFFTESADTVLGDPPLDETDTDGWYGQLGYLWSNGVEIAGRYSELLLDVEQRDETEAGVAFGYHFVLRRRAADTRILRGNKLQVDYRRLEFEFMPLQPGDPVPEEFIDRDELRVQLQLVF